MGNILSSLLRLFFIFWTFQNELIKACGDLQTSLSKEEERALCKGEMVRQSKEKLAQLQVIII